MGYTTFLCLFIWRFLIAFLAHLNWFTAVYLKCIYFTLWKSYDLLWFWMHLVLCICFEPLRSENYLLVWATLFYKKCTTGKNKSFRQIYNQTYNQKFTKSERELKRLEIQEINENEQDSDSEDENGADESSNNGNGSGKPTHSGHLYPKLHADGGEEQAMPTLGVSRKPNSKNANVNFRTRVEGEALIRDPSGQNVEDGADTSGGEEGKKKKRGLLSKLHMPAMIKGRSSSDNSSGHSPRTPESADSENGNGGGTKWKDKLPKLLRKSSPEEDEAAREKEEAKKTLAMEEKRRRKEEKARKKQQLREIRERRKEYLRKKAAEERRRKLISDSIELLLQCLRLFTSFAILTGNIHKTFMPSYLIADQNRINNPEVLMMFTITMGFEMMLFWLTCFMTFCKQCRLCWRMGCCLFMLWLAALIFLGGFCMYQPMILVADQLDMTWCKFEVGTPLAEFFYSD